MIIPRRFISLPNASVVAEAPRAFSAGRGHCAGLPAASPVLLPQRPEQSGASGGAVRAVSGAGAAGTAPGVPGNRNPAGGHPLLCPIWTVPQGGRAVNKV